MDKKKIGKAALITGAVLGTTFVVMRQIAKKQYPKTVYDDKPEEKNPMEGKKVVFVECDDDEVNADGKRGHLKAVGTIEHIPTFYEKYVKRGFDIALSFGGMVVLAPVIGGLALVIKAEDPGPFIFSQKRIAAINSNFSIYKIRSMRLETPKNVPTHMLDNPDQYILKAGKYIRRFSLDELGQLWNVFLGNMSIIGPRPALWNQDFLIAERDKYGANDVKPGLTGLAQISGRDELEIPVKAKLDGEYVTALKKSSWSGFIMDIKCFLGTIKSVLKSEGVVEGGTGEMNKSISEPITEDMNNSEKFTVLMSVYEKENAVFFEEALKSNIDDQTRKPDEFVLVCDGPLTEDLDSVIEKYEKKYPEVLRVYRTEHNQGLGKALNFGLTKCTNDIVVRSDSDDICAPERFEVLVSYMENHKEIAVCSSYIDEFDTDWKKPDKKKTLPLTNDELLKMAKFRNPINHMAAAFRKNTIVEIGSYKHIPYVEDYELWVRTLINGYKLANIDRILVHARVGNGMVSRRGNRKYINSWRELSRYMLEHKMISHVEYCRNMIAVRAFVYTPGSVKEILYKTLLRR